MLFRLSLSCLLAKSVTFFLQGVTGRARRNSRCFSRLRRKGFWPSMWGSILKCLSLFLQISSCTEVHLENEKPPSPSRERSS
ncbi:hypothetical protein PISMIDRAFT_680421 [Pisolithus microcarpus 441]|uniref:Uncharacterized protein n=1 Tax=Pisolithus microcarpus 441 TaxID=765257 RepID=A0A0C9ZRL5_9AGAM|nr:hypothetical protein BKA83DRAFT_680421 [Pisolithus microcarpus]KIK22383.1 hypothetical protein PISMIDRAFT_680421 [Pisolithus microcarpus 441]